MAIDESLLKQRLNKHYPLKATKFDVLKFIGERENITVNDLMDHFRYMPKGANSRIESLAREELITSWIMPGQWCLTQEGERRLKYYADKEKSKD
jgi:DNA-binding MarR family transcriptional regulator